jgi:putative membrane protein
VQIIIDLLINTVAIIVAAYLLPGVRVDSFLAALLAAAVLAVINTFVKPIFIILTLPLTILTLGLFILVINTVVILLVSLLVPGFEVTGFWWALLFSFVLWIVNSILHALGERIRSAD